MTALGIGAALAAALANAFAVVLQAVEARRSPDEEAMRASLLLDLARRRRWLAGTGLLLAAWALQVFALSLAPIAIVQPTLSTSSLVLLAIARVRLGERVGRHEALAAIILVGGLAAIVWATPRHSASTHAQALSPSLLAPLAVVGGAALLAYLVGRWHQRVRLLLVLGAGLAYAWSDFADKLLAMSSSAGEVPLSVLWVFAVVSFGALAFLEENSALQHRPAVTVAPVISAVKVPLPVLMALWAGVERWSARPTDVAILLAGLTLVAAGAATLGRSEAVARISGGTDSESEPTPPTASSVGIPADARQGSADGG